MIEIYQQLPGDSKNRQHVATLDDFYRTVKDENVVDVCYRVHGTAERLIGGKMVNRHSRLKEPYWVLVMR